MLKSVKCIESSDGDSHSENDGGGCEGINGG